MKRWGVIFLVILFLIGFVVAVVNIFVSQSPADLDAFNVLGQSLNITYNISDAALNTSTIQIFYKLNSSSSDTGFFFTNGTLTSGFQSRGHSFNLSELFTFRLFHEQVYPATYNYNETYAQSAPHVIYDLDENDEYVKIRLFNVSNQKNFSFFEVWADNQTTASNSLRIYYCNSSYVSGNPATSVLCTNFYNMEATELFNHTHQVSKHHVIPFSINTSSGTIGSIVVTNLSYFLLRGRLGVNAWNVYYIENVSRTDSVQFSVNAGGAWTNLNGTVSAHFHQYNGTESFWYYSCANDTIGNENCTSLRRDLIESGGLPPSSANVFAPMNQSYKGNIFINYTAATSPNGYSITGYNISLFNYTDSFILTIKENNSNNLSYVWDSTGVVEGVYNIHVRGCDTNGLCSVGESDDFILDNTPPSIILSCGNEYIYIGDVVTCSCSATDISGVNTTSYTEHPSTINSGTYPTTCTVTDNMGNSATASINYEVRHHAQSGGGGGGGSGSSVKPTTSTIINSEENFTSTVTENKTIEISVEENTYLLNVSEMNDSVSIIFSYDNVERIMSIGDEISYEIGENIITIKFEGIGKEGAILNTSVKKKIPAKDYTWIAFSIVIGVLAVIFIIKLIMKIFSKKLISKVFRHKSVNQKIERKIRQAERLKKKAEELIKESEKIKKENILKKKAFAKVKEANSLLKKSEGLAKQARKICKKCNIPYNKFHLN